ncbi:hypothetical protein C1H46_034291 [Malus baccata]|uniref:Retrotransposon Copia-like N-terminal domain-containing protein n=1 Tax=Malus baccata TaxID=106549 RepID=A0A540L137_MALBA|nr:hypothetical protein C1H46_034291 [Malus baccata]
MSKDELLSGSNYDAKADTSNPLFIHHSGHSDHPSMMLVSKPLNGHNYFTCPHAMKISLGANNKLGFVDGTVTQLFAKAKLADYSSWQRCNEMINAWPIITNV